MKTDEVGSLDSSTTSFAEIFDEIIAKLQLALDPEETRLLYEAASLAALCNVFFNSFEGEAAAPVFWPHGWGVEVQYLERRAALYATPGWQALPASKRGWIDRLLLHVASDPQISHAEPGQGLIPVAS